MRYYYTFIIILLFSFVEGSSQSRISLSQKFIGGETYKYEIKRGGKENPRNPDSNEFFVITSATATATNGLNNLISISFKYGESRIAGTNATPELIENYKKQELYYGIEVSFTVTGKGKFVGLTNYSHVKEQLQNAMIKIYRNSGTQIDGSVLNQIKSQIDPTYDTEEKLLYTYFPELSIYFNALGNKYKKGETKEIKYESSNPFGGEAYPITASVVFSKLDGSIAIIQSVETIERDDFNRIMISTLKKMAEAGNQPFHESDVPNLNIETNCEMRYNIQTEKLLSVTLNKRITTKEMDQNSITEIRLID